MELQQIYSQIQPLIKRDFDRLSKEQAGSNRYSVNPIAIHSHNGIDSPPVPYRNLFGVDSYLTSNTVSVPSSRILTANTIPIILIPPPSARTVIIVHSVTVRITYGTTPYTGTHNMEFHYTDGTGAQVTDSIPAAFINSASSGFYHAPAVANSFIPVEGGAGPNGQIVAFVNTANPAAGNSTMTFVIHYHLVSFAT